MESLILNSPYCEPTQHWRYTGPLGGHERTVGRREASYIIHDTRSRGRRLLLNRREVKLNLVNQIRPQIAQWRKDGFPGVTATTRQLLEHWRKERERDDKRFFFCQLEAIETLIWLAETPAGMAVNIPGDGGELVRQCVKLATGTGKTVVMAMMVAWQALNRAAAPDNIRFAGDFLVVAPGLTVRRRLSVLNPETESNYYKEFDIIPNGLRGEFNSSTARVLVRNWQALRLETKEQVQKKRSVDKRGPRSLEAWTRETLRDISDADRVVVINDEAHHAWRPLPGLRVVAERGERDAAKEWLKGLERLHKSRSILRCYDFSATPFIPTGHANIEKAVFPWIVSDFGLNDAIESGLVKTPLIVAGDNAPPDPATGRSQFWHIYPHVKDDLNRSGAELDPLPQLVSDGYALLGQDWSEHRDLFKKNRQQVPPVMISVVNDTRIAERIMNAVGNGEILESACSHKQTLKIDSKELQKAESAENGSMGGDGQFIEETVKQRAERLREQVHTVGREGKPGEKLEHVISVAMLSEGWDARTVTQIMGLRAFTSQLLCEQVVGRGLRRMSYETDKDDMLSPEYVNIFGVPFDLILQGEPGMVQSAAIAAQKVPIFPVMEKLGRAIRWPRVARVNFTMSDEPKLNWRKVRPLTLRASGNHWRADLAGVVDGGAQTQPMRCLDLSKSKFPRLQTLAFRAAAQIVRSEFANWPGDKMTLVAQLMLWAEKFINGRKLKIVPDLPRDEDGIRRRNMMISLNYGAILSHFAHAIVPGNRKARTIVLDDRHPIGETGDMLRWYTGRNCVPPHLMDKCHINLCPMDSGWEENAAGVFARLPQVEAWVKNDHIGFDIYWSDGGVARKFRPDFLLRLSDKIGQKKNLILEVKGRMLIAPETKLKVEAAEEWVKAVNEHGGFGEWHFAQAESPDDVEEIVRHICSNPPA